MIRSVEPRSSSDNGDRATTEDGFEILGPESAMALAASGMFAPKSGPSVRKLALADR